MKIIIFKIHICGMSNRNISRKIMIYKPYKTITKFLCFNRCWQEHISTAEDLISYIKNQQIIFLVIQENMVQITLMSRIYILNIEVTLQVCNTTKIWSIFSTFFKKASLNLSTFMLLAEHLVSITAISLLFIQTKISIKTLLMSTSKEMVLLLDIFQIPWNESPLTNVHMSTCAMKKRLLNLISEGT